MPLLSPRAAPRVLRLRLSRRRPLPLIRRVRTYTSHFEFHLNHPETRNQGKNRSNYWTLLRCGATTTSKSIKRRVPNMERVHPTTTGHTPIRFLPCNSCNSRRCSVAVKRDAPLVRCRALLYFSVHRIIGVPEQPKQPHHTTESRCRRLPKSN